MRRNATPSLIIALALAATSFGHRAKADDSCNAPSSTNLARIVLSNDGKTPPALELFTPEAQNMFENSPLHVRFAVPPIDGKVICGVADISLTSVNANVAGAGTQEIDLTKDGFVLRRSLIPQIKGLGATP